MPSPQALAKNRAEGPERAKRSDQRRKAVRNALAGYTPSPHEVATTAAMQASRAALKVARASFDSAIGASADQIAGRLVELALGGDVNALLAVVRSVVPPARYDSVKIRLDIGALDTLADVDAARRKVAMAVFQEEIGVEDGNNINKMLDSIAEGILRNQKMALLDDMRATLSEATATSVTARITSLTQKAELVLGGLRGGAEVPLVEAAAEPVEHEVEVEEDGPNGWRQFA
jgi:hypothetical protein